MPKHGVFAMGFTSVDPTYVQKAERRARTKGEVDRVKGRPMEKILRA